MLKRTLRYQPRGQNEYVRVLERTNETYYEEEGSVMEGTKQCPNCESTDVPLGAAVCPFCGYMFEKYEKQSGAKPVGADRMPETGQAEEKMPADSATDAGDRTAVPGAPAAPASTEYMVYQKKGKKKQKDPNVSQQGQGRRTVISSLAAALTMTALYMGNGCFSTIVLWQTQFLMWVYILAGILAAATHYCCFNGDKGSRKAGAAGIIAGNIVFSCCIVSKYNMPIFYAFSTAFWSMLHPIVTYMACWLMAAKSAKSSKSAVWFWLAAVEAVSFPYLLTGVLSFFYYMSGLINDISPLSASWPGLAVGCVVMLLTELLLYRVRARLAVKPGRLFWVLYLVVVIGVLLWMFGSLNWGRLGRYIIF